MEKNHNSLNINVLSRKALIISAFFCACFLSSTYTFADSDNNTVDCSRKHYDETASVKYVHDGDTLHLTDKRKIRLIGIDTPELARKGKTAQIYAREARRFLKSLVSSSNNTVHLLYDTDKKDRYGRTLAHLFLNDGTNIQSELIKHGLAIAYTVPPNTLLSDCYSSIEDLSRQSKRGIWSHRKYKTKSTKQLKADSEGFHLLKSKLNSISTKGKHIWLKLSNKVSIRIKKKDRQYFNLDRLNCMRGKTVEIRGWLHANKDGYFMALRHPSALRLIGSDQC